MLQRQDQKEINYKAEATTAKKLLSKDLRSDSAETTQCG